MHTLDHLIWSNVSKKPENAWYSKLWVCLGGFSHKKHHIKSRSNDRIRKSTRRCKTELVTSGNIRAQPWMACTSIHMYFPHISVAMVCFFTTSFLGFITISSKFRDVIRSRIMLSVIHRKSRFGLDMVITLWKQELAEAIYSSSSCSGRITTPEHLHNDMWQRQMWKMAT